MLKPESFPSLHVHFEYYQISKYFHLFPYFQSFSKDYSFNISPRDFYWKFSISLSLRSICFLLVVLYELVLFDTDFSHIRAPKKKAYSRLLRQEHLQMFFLYIITNTFILVSIKFSFLDKLCFHQNHELLRCLICAYLFVAIFSCFLESPSVSSLNLFYRNSLSFLFMFEVVF